MYETFRLVIRVFVGCFVFTGYACRTNLGFLPAARDWIIVIYTILKRIGFLVFLDKGSCVCLCWIKHILRFVSLTVNTQWYTCLSFSYSSLQLLWRNSLSKSFWRFFIIIVSVWLCAEIVNFCLSSSPCVFTRQRECNSQRSGKASSDLRSKIRYLFFQGINLNTIWK